MTGRKLIQEVRWAEEAGKPEGVRFPRWQAPCLSCVHRPPSQGAVFYSGPLLTPDSRLPPTRSAGQAHVTRG